MPLAEMARERLSPLATCRRRRPRAADFRCRPVGGGTARAPKHADQVIVKLLDPSLDADGGRQQSTADQQHAGPEQDADRTGVIRSTG